MEKEYIFNFQNVNFGWVEVQTGSESGSWNKAKRMAKNVYLLVFRKKVVSYLIQLYSSTASRWCVEFFALNSNKL